MRKPKPKKTNKIREQISVQKTEIYSGILPRPETMAGYQQIDPSFPERIISMAEKEQQHSHKIEKQRNVAILVQTTIGLLAGLIALGTLVFLTYLAITSKQTTVAVAIIGAMAAVISVFIYKGKSK